MVCIFFIGVSMRKEDVEKGAEKVSEEIKKSAKNAAEKVEQVAQEIEQKAEEAADEIERTVEDTDIFTVEEGAPVDGKTVEEIDKGDFLGVDAVVVEVEREGEEIVPKGDTLFKARDLVKIHSPHEIVEKTRKAFQKE